MDQYEFELQRQRGETIQAAVVRLCKWLPITGISYCGYLAVAALAGHTTIAKFGLLLIADLKANSVVSHLVMGLFGIGGVSYGVNERRLRRKNIERMSRQNAVLEQKIDAGRSSSQLTKRGTTRPEDQI